MEVFQRPFDDHQELLVLLRMFIWHSLVLAHLGHAGGMVRTNRDLCGAQDSCP